MRDITRRVIIEAYHSPHIRNGRLNGRQIRTLCYRPRGALSRSVARARTSCTRDGSGITGITPFRAYRLSGAQFRGNTPGTSLATPEDLRYSSSAEPCCKSPPNSHRNRRLEDSEFGLPHSRTAQRFHSLLHEDLKNSSSRSIDAAIPAGGNCLEGVHCVLHHRRGYLCNASFLRHRALMFFAVCATSPF